MSSLTAPQLAIGLSLLCGLIGVLMIPAGLRSARVAARIRSVRSPSGQQQEEVGTSVPIWIRLLDTIGRTVLGSGLLSAKAIEDLRQTMTAAGYRNGLALSMFIGAKLMLFAALPMLAWIILNTTGLKFPPLLVMAVAAVLGLMLPDFVVRNIRKRYLKGVETGMPAALDLLIICAEAGLALEAGLERVADEAQEGAHAAANELRITANEMKVLADRRQALVNMGKRTELDSMIRLGSTLAQSLKYGTPLTQALRVLAAEMRQTVLTQFEARAARIPVLLTIPMILFILPCIFVVVAGPAAIQVMAAR